MVSVVDVAASATLTVAATVFSSSSSSSSSLCTSTLYPAWGVVTLADLGLPITLAEPLVEQIPCGALTRRADAHDDDDDDGSSKMGDAVLTEHPLPSGIMDATESEKLNNMAVVVGASSSVMTTMTTTTTPSLSSPAANSSPDSKAKANMTASSSSSNTFLDAPTGTATALATLNFNSGSGISKTPHISSFGDPFYLSTSPIIYALAATTIVSYMLVIALFITTRSFFDGGIVYLGSRSSFTASSSSGTVSIGGRPWLQKIAALTVAISLTIATADTMSIVKEQYGWGITNAPELQREVMSRLELKVIRIISDTFLWLAQAQTLIRLFPRHREKVVIKWVAFALISLDVVFSSLNSFPFAEYDILNRGPTGPSRDGSPSNKNLAHPVPAISYVFQLSLGLLYFIWVSYYAFLKRRYAFYHPLMKNICLVAIISLFSITVPIVFFILDISKPNFTAWGDYVRWVGAAAASVVVWEWVERIEALEREEKKDGVLGREVYDGDDMLEINAADYPWRHKHVKFGGNGNSGAHGHHGNGGHAWVPGGGGGGGGGVGGATTLQTGYSLGSYSHEQESGNMSENRRAPLWSQRAAQVATPVSRTDTPSVASTVYAVRYQGESRTPEPPTPHYVHDAPELTRPTSVMQNYSEDGHESSEARGEYHYNNNSNNSNSNNLSSRETTTITMPAAPTSSRVVRSVSYSNEVEMQDSAEETGQQQQQQQQQQTRPSIMTRITDSSLLAHGSRGSSSSRGGRWDIRGRFEDFAASQADRFREKFHPLTDTDKLPVTIVPAPARVGAALQQVLEEEEAAAAAVVAAAEEGCGESCRQQRRRSWRGDVASVVGSCSAIEAAASTASERYAAAAAAVAAVSSHRIVVGQTAQNGGSGGGGNGGLRPVPVNSPPLWPGVNGRAAAAVEEEEDEEGEGEGEGSFDGEGEEEGISLSDELSVIEREGR